LDVFIEYFMNFSNPGMFTCIGFYSYLEFIEDIGHRFLVFCSGCFLFWENYRNGQRFPIKDCVSSQIIDNFEGIVRVLMSTFRQQLSVY